MTDVSRRQLLAGAAGLAAVGGLAAACGSGSSSSSTSPSSTAPAGTPKRGGNFRLGVTGGGAKDIMDGQNIITKPDQARLMTAFETLLLFDENYQLTNNGLAESVTQDNPKQYTIKLRKGIYVFTVRSAPPALAGRHLRGGAHARPRSDTGAPRCHEDVARKSHRQEPRPAPGGPGPANRRAMT